MRISYKVFILFALLSVLAAVLMLPYTMDLLGDALEEARMILGVDARSFTLILLVQSSVLYIVASFIGLLLYSGAGFRMPWIEKWIEGKKVSIDRNEWIRVTLIGGIAVGTAIILGDWIFMQLGSPLNLFEAELPAWWRGLFAAAGAGIGEEILMRLFLMTALTFLFHRGLRLPQSLSAGVALLLAALVFGLGHLPATQNLVTLTPLIVTRALLLNGVGGVAFGWLYWKHGLESAMVAHFLADVLIHGIVPLAF